MHLLPILLTAGAVFLLSMIATRAAIMLANRLRFVDRPGAEAHKQQARAVPYGGGAAMGIALAAGLLACHLLRSHIPGTDAGAPLDHGSLIPIYVGALVLLVLGLVDDRKPVPAGLKLAVQAIVAGGVVWTADLQVDSLQSQPWLAYGLAWVWMVLITNAFNLLDHADGLSASVAIVSIVVLLSGALMAGDLQLAALWILLIAVLLGFLVWNLPPARVYMGDAGSLPLGFLIGAGTLSVTFWPSAAGGSSLAVLSPFIITAIPLFDATVVVVKRALAGKPIMVGDRNHISHRLTRLGLGSRTSLAVVVALQIALAASALQLRFGDAITGIVIIAQDCSILIAVILLETLRDTPDTDGGGGSARG
ncbi:MAG: undecaprenyl/decaprenyl-phosphate alpha-N-acetylglucosaminyl 1-phosphate transferase [Planctomycetes bacterium]|nr:undecaprenyl/decaprenyl-phosphate alpha-N-acetylglucosaminyl 1-phosphate transferase [Planctomycetota bacterium]